MCEARCICNIPWTLCGGSGLINCALPRNRQHGQACLCNHGPQSLAGPEDTLSLAWCSIEQQYCYWTAGNFSSFLFELLPKVAVYTPSGANQNFQYCGHNFASLPNGIGFGGQVSISLILHMFRQPGMYGLCETHCMLQPYNCLCCPTCIILTCLPVSKIRP